MKWIKATERLPEANVRKCIRIHGAILGVGHVTGHYMFWEEGETPGYRQNDEIEWLDESPLPSNEDELNEDIQRDNDSLYTYFQIDFEDWGEEWDYIIVETLDEVRKYLELAEIHLDDPTRKTKVIVSGIAMTPPAFREWQKENLP